MLSTFTLDALPPVARARALRNAFAGYAMPVALRMREIGTVRARLSAANLGRARVEQFDVRGVTGTATRSLTTKDSSIPRTLTLHHVDAGAVVLRHGDRRATVPATTTVLTDSALPLEMGQQGHIGMTTLTVPHDALRLPESAIRGVLSLPIGSELPIATVIAGTVHRIASDATHFPSASWHVLDDALVELVRAMVLLANGDERAAREPLGASLAERILGYLDRHVLDADLTAERLAAVHGISVRYLYVVLNRRDISLGEWIRSARIRRAAELLREDARMPIADVAYRCGFGDHAHFSRAFRAAFGMTPTEWRAR